MEAILAFDESVLLFIQEHMRTDFLTTIMLAITTIGNNGMCWIILGVILLFFKKTRRGGLIMLLCLAGAWLVNDFVLKTIFMRARPYDAMENLIRLDVLQTDSSFPSGHTNASFASAFALTMVFGKKGAWAYVLAVLIGISRCYVGVHYPTDVLGGMIVGTLMALAVYALIVYIEMRRNRQLFTPKT